jgi:hypothetical protein
MAEMFVAVGRAERAKNDPQKIYCFVSFFHAQTVPTKT